MRSLTKLILIRMFLFISVPNLIVEVVLIERSENEILQITSKDYMYCISEETTDAAMFTFPHLNSSQDSNGFIDDRFWINDDWIIKRSTDSTRMVVLDSRWSEFKIMKTNYIRFTKSTTTLSFSVYGTNHLQFFVDDGALLEYVEEATISAEIWTTYTIFWKDGSVYFFRENEFWRQTHLPPPHQFVIKSTTDAYFKIYDYTYREARVSNNKENSTLLRISTDNISFLFIYAALCRSCILEVTYNSETLNITSNTEQDDMLETWQIYNFTINPLISNEVTFVRRQDDPTEDRYWKLDVRLRNCTYNIGIFKLDSEDKTPICKYLHAREETQISNRGNMVDPVNVSCQAGVLGKTCSIRCADILGKQYSYCENHKIWYNNTYECLWGYNGDSCDEECENGQYGFSCNQECPNGCPSSCDKKTGECEKTNELAANVAASSVDASKVQIYAIIILLLVILIIIIALLILLRRRHVEPASPDVALVPLDKRQE